MNFHKFPSILILFFVAVFFAGCEQNHINSSINLSVSPPTQIDSRSLPTVCSDHSRADITIDNRLIGTLEKQEASARWQTLYRHTIRMCFELVRRNISRNQ